MQVELSVDIGGTFTDVVVARESGRVSRKVLTTHDAPERGVIEGAEATLASAGASFREVSVLVHGATLATNAIIERKGAKTALVATEGFRDVIEIADESRFDQYDLNIGKPSPLVPRAARFTALERVDVQGRVRTPLDEAAARDLAGRIAAEGFQAVAVAFLHAYADPRHERRMREILLEANPALEVSLSSEVCPEMREYERTSTTVANAYVQPLMAGYLRRLAAAFEARGCRALMRLMTSGGHLASVETACRFPVRLIESGPAGGAILAAETARERGEARTLSFDMGGTTAKICLIDDGTPLKARTFEVDRSARFLKGSGLPLRIPVIDMIEIGAGGGSLASVNALGGISVGPESAGSEPGPACYGRGGSRPAVTDADLVLGRIAPDRFAGGRMPLDAAAAEAALARAVAAPLDLPLALAAHGVAEIVEENMANAARAHAVERGVALGGYTMVAFGGAAPLHAARVAEKLGLRRIVVPSDAGVGSAVGFLRAPRAYEVVRSLYMRLDSFDAAAAAALLAEMSAEARSLAAGETLEERRAAFMRYRGQGHEIAVALPLRPLTQADAGALRAGFEAEYARLFARRIPDAAIEILGWSVEAAAPPAPTEPLPAAPPRPGPAPLGERAVFDPAVGEARATPVYARSDFAAGARVAGPALVVEDQTTTYASALFDVTLDAGGALVLERRAEARP